MLLMPRVPAKHLYLPAKDRSFWKSPDDSALPLLYLAWGRRDFTDRGVPASRHEGWVCVCIEEGSPTMILGDRSIRLSTGQVVLIREDCPLGWEQSDERDCKFLLWMWRRPLHPELSMQPASASAIHRVPTAQREIWQILHRLCREEIVSEPAPSAAWLESCQRQLEVLLVRLLQASPETGTADRRIALALAWMQSHLQSQEPVARLCDYLGISQPTLHRLFVNQTGLSPMVQFQRIKMERAQQLLADGRSSVKEVAFLLGYRHFNDFSRAFRKHFKQTPSVSRRTPLG